MSNEQSVLASQIKMLSDSAEALISRGQFEDAEHVYEQVLKAAPYHIRSLDFLAGRAYERGDSDVCLELLGRSLRASPDRPAAYQNLALVYKARKQYDLALEAIDRALQLQPNYPMAQLHKATLLELTGRNRDAVCASLQAFQQAPELQQAQHSERVPVQVREIIAQCASMIVGARQAMLDAALAPLRGVHDAAALDRVEQFAELYMGKRAPEYRHDLQRPSFMYFPGLEPRAFFESGDFDWAPELEAATPGILDELHAVLQQPESLKPYVEIAAPDAREWNELNHSPQWSAYHFYKAGRRDDEHCRQCPMTTEVIEKLPMVRTPGQSPEAFFSILNPNTHIPPHVGLANYKLTVHLPLIVPEGCRIRVGDETRTWTAGRCLILDDSFQHEAWNDSDELRAVLILEVWNPQLSEVERQAVSAVLGVMADFNREYTAPAPVPAA